MDLHDHETSGREIDPCPLGQVVQPVAWGPGAEPRCVGDLVQARVGNGCLAEARPALPVDVVGLGLGGQVRRHQEQNGVVVFAAAGEELAGDDVRIPLDVRIHDGAVVVVGRPGRCFGCVRSRLLDRDGGDRVGRSLCLGAPGEGSGQPGRKQDEGTDDKRNSGGTHGSRVARWPNRCPDPESGPARAATPPARVGCRRRIRPVSPIDCGRTPRGPVCGAPLPTFRSDTRSSRSRT